MKKEKNPNRLVKGLKTFGNAIMGLIIAVLKTVFVDMFRNIGMYLVFAYKPEERKKMRNKLEAEKMMKLMDDRTAVVERLVYSVFEDPEYTKRPEGKYDLKELRKAVGKK